MKMMLQLAQDGIFPVTKDENGQPLSDLPASGFDFPGTIQGEGKLSGVPSLFIRLAGCNLHCSWQTADGNISECDTVYAAFRVKNSTSWTIDNIYTTIRHNAGNINHIVITGGEPFLQEEPLIELCHKLNTDNHYHLTVETNATIFSEKLADCFDFFSMSPKLASSVPPDSVHNTLRVNPTTLQAFIDHARKHAKDFQLKFVCSCDEDITEIKSILSELHGWKDEDILLMPLGATPEELRFNTRKTLTYSIRNNWRYCDRLHLSLFGAKNGV